MKQLGKYFLTLSMAGYFVGCAAGGDENNAETGLFRLSFDPAISEKAVVDLIKDARKTIDVSLYGFENSNVASALIEAHQRRGVKVQMSTEFDSESLSGYQKVIAVGIQVKLGNTSGIQHNKYFIVDKKYVVTGSTNLTGSHPPESSGVSGMWAHYNNLVVLKSEGIAAEFQKDFNVQFKGGKYEQDKDAEYNVQNSSTTWPEITYDVGALKINAYFTPYQTTFSTYSANIMGDPDCGTTPGTVSITDTNSMLTDCAKTPTVITQPYCYQAAQNRVIYHYYNYDKDVFTCSATAATTAKDNYRSALNIVISLFRNAKKSINCLFFAFTDRVLMNELKKAKARGVDVKIYMDYNQYRSQYRNSGKSFVNLRQEVGFVKLVRQANSGLNHHKVVFTDDENLILGSMNYSSAAVTSNDENFLLIKNAGALISQFKQEQRRIDEQSFLLPPVEDDGSYISDPGD